MYVNLPVFPGSESFSVVPVTCVLNCSIYRGHGEFSVEVGSTGEKRFDSKTRMWNGGWGGCGGKLKLCTNNWGIKQQKMQILCSFEEIALITSALLWVNLIQTPGVFRGFQRFPFTCGNNIWDPIQLPRKHPDASPVFFFWKRCAGSNGNHHQTQVLSLPNSSRYLASRVFAPPKGLLRRCLWVQTPTHQVFGRLGYINFRGCNPSWSSIPSLKLTCSHLKIDGWVRWINFLLEFWNSLIFRGRC